MSLAVLTPYVRGRAQESAGRWWKKLLPVGEINYKGRVLKFSKDYLSGLTQSFRDRAYDQVPFQLAGDDNKHTNDVERFGGEIADMQLRDDGLWVAVKPTDRGGRVLADNPKVGVSARIVEGYDRSDGKYFPRAIQHVLATLDPRIPGMGGWEAVAAANDAEVTFDLSGEQFTGEEPGMPELTEEQQTKLAKLLNLDPDALTALVAGMEPAPSAGAPGAPGEPGDPDDTGDPEMDALMASIDGMTDAELDALEADMEAEDAGQPEPAALSGQAAMAVELAQATGDENARQLSIIGQQLDHERWLSERRKLVGGGIPPFIADLAQPLLEGAGHVVDLAGGTSVDAGQITRKILTETGKILTQLGLQTDVELGTAMDEPDGQDSGSEREDVVTRAKAQLFGIV